MIKTSATWLSKPAKRQQEAGMSMLELMLAISVLAVGMAGISVLFNTSILTNNRAKVDTSATMLAQAVLEKIAAQPANQATSVSITDCAATPNTWVIATAGAAPPGNGADLNASNGAIDFSQPYAAVPASYAMQFAGCGAGNRQITFEVRWNIQTVTANTRLITVAARPLAAAADRPMHFVQPITLRTIGGL